jgi:glycosyltransferase 2 family protein
MKKYLRWVLVSAVLVFLSQAVWRNWQTVAAVRISSQGWGILTIALLVSLLAHIVAGCVWATILQSLGQSVTAFWGATTYLTTNLAKYLPGNVWHFYGRFNACKKRDIPSGASLLSILLEPLLMLAAALIITIGLSPWTNLIQMSSGFNQGLLIGGGAIVGLIAVLLGIQPAILNRLLQKIGGAKRKRLAISPQDIPQIRQYPWQPLIGELFFLGLRGTGFVLTWCAVHSIAIDQLPKIYSSFSLAWLLGLVIPGLPGGIGVFEAVILTLLGTQLIAGELLIIVGLYRLVNTLAEAIGAGLASVIHSNK